MPKSNRFYQAQTHKNVTRDRFIRSVNPVVGLKMRAILEELKRKDRELTQKIVGEVMKVVTAHAKKENYSLIFERSTVMTADEAVDITDTIIKLYDAGK